MCAAVSHPSVIWAQRKNCVFLTICLDDVKDPDIKVDPGKVFFKGSRDGKEYEAQIDLFSNIKTEDSKHVTKARNIEFCLKKEEEKFWPRLTKDSVKVPWIKVDFNKWKDEDDSDEEVGGPGGGGGGGDFEEMMRQMGGLGGMGGGPGGMGGMPGMGGMGMGMGDKPSLDDLDGNQTDSDDEDEALPDLE